MHGMTTDGKVLNNGKPIVAVDIDGTMADYHGYFLRFAEDYLGKKMPDPSEINPGLRLSEFMGVDHETYRQVKLAYRQGGLKRSMPAFEGAKEMCERIIRAGAELWICTTRPYLRLDNIDPDTREWLDRNEIPYTAMVFGDSKYEDLVESVGADRIVAVIEDLPEMANRAFDAGIMNVIMPERPYNRGIVDKVNGNGSRLHKSNATNLHGAATTAEYYIGKFFKEHERVAAEPEVTFSHNNFMPSSRNIPLAENQYEIDREARWSEIIDETFGLFIRKSRDYGATGDTLGAKGQFADMWRKFGKIKNQVWDNPDREPDFEGTKEILMDLIGHSILFIDYLNQEDK